MKGILIFLAGAGVGAGISYYLCKEYFEEQAAEEIESVKEAFRAEKDIQNVEEKKTEKRVVELDDSKRDAASYDPDDLKKYRDIIQTNYGIKIDEERKEKPKMHAADVESPPEDDPDAPFIISEDEYNDFFENDNIQLTYYKRPGVLMHFAGYEVNIHDFIGETLADISDDTHTFYVRNNKRGEDYEIFVDMSTEVM